jgi:hypothetical protein
MNTVWESFQGATLLLVRSGSIKDRLSEAWRQHLVKVDSDSLPRDLRDEFVALAGEFTREAPAHRGEDSVRATIRKMSNEDADRIAARVVQLFAAMPRSMTVPRAQAIAQVVPLFLAEAPEHKDKVAAAGG